MRVWWNEHDVDLDDFRSVVEQTTNPAHYPYAVDVRQGVPIFDCEALQQSMRDLGARRAMQADLVRACTEGPGLVVLAGAFVDTSVVDRATAAFEDLIEHQRASQATASDHFAPAGANDRIWNALEKLALNHPDVFVDYYANDALALVSSAWLGPGYQLTSQVNVVNPGGAAQSPHRDYHLGFMTDEAAAAFPAHVHRLSPALTLQGAVAHTDMPVETGPTMYLPHSHKYEPGYLAWRRQEFIDYFAEHHVQLPLTKGDAVFFNPALMHGAGTNRTGDVRRMANLLQVSSPFGRAMETVDRAAMCAAVLGQLATQVEAGVVDEQALGNVVAATAEGYPFPTNLDRDPPVDGLAPQTQADLLHRAVAEGWGAHTLRGELATHARRRSTS